MRRGKKTIWETLIIKSILTLDPLTYFHKTTSKHGTRAEFDDSESSLGEDETGSDLQDGNIGQGEPNPIEEVKAIANLENRILAFWKVIVVISILLTGAAVSVKVFWFLDNKQEIEFENQVSRNDETQQYVVGELHVT